MKTVNRTAQKIAAATYWREVAGLLDTQARLISDTAKRDRVLYVIEHAGINAVDSTKELLRSVERDGGDLPTAQKYCFIGSIGVLLTGREENPQVLRWFRVRGITG